MDEKKIKKLLKNSKTCIMATDNGCAVVGIPPIVLNNFTLLVTQLKNEFTQEELEQAFKRAFMEPAELLNEIVEMVKDLENKLKKEKTTKKESE